MLEFAIYSNIDNYITNKFVFCVTQAEIAFEYKSNVICHKNIVQNVVHK